MAAFRKRCGRALQTVELRRAFAEGSGDPTLMAMVRATHQKRHGGRAAPPAPPSRAPGAEMRWRSVSVRTVAIGWALVALQPVPAENLDGIGPTYRLPNRTCWTTSWPGCARRSAAENSAKFEQLARARASGPC